MSCPGSKVTEFAVIAIIGQPHLRTNEEDLFVVYDDPAVVIHVFVVYRPLGPLADEARTTRKLAYAHSDITNDTFNLLGPQDLREDLP